MTTHPTQRTWHGTAQPSLPHPNWRLPEPFEPRGLLGMGGMGEVVLAWDPDMEREVAIKCLSLAHLDHPATIQRFERESQIMATLDHPAIVAVHARGRLEDGRPWYAMRVVRGEPLDRWLEQAPPSPRRFGKLVSVLDALAYAHSRGWVHGDIKPENILIGPFGEVQILDWGIAHRVGTVWPAGVGTPGYMSPEQRRGTFATAAFDAFSVGRVLHELTPSEALRSLADDLTSADPDARPTVEEAARRLDAWIDGTEARQRGQNKLAAMSIHDMRSRELAQRSHEARRRAVDTLENLGLDAPAVEKEASWSLLDQADQDAEAAAIARAKWVRGIHEALRDAPDLDEAHEALAEHHHEAYVLARGTGDRAAMARHRHLLEAHDRGRFAALLSGRGTLTLRTDPPGLDVHWAPLVSRGRRLQSDAGRHIGQTPLEQVSLPEGTAVLRVGGHVIAVDIRAGEHTNFGPPGDEDRPICVPPPRDDAVWVPPGWFQSGGDPLATDGLPRRRLWTGGYFIQRNPVTNADYLRFLNSIPHLDIAWGHAPGAVGEHDTLGVERRDDRFVLKRTPGDSRNPGRWPVCMVTWESAVAYAAWWSSHTGRQWTLPHDQQWEKAARGVDGRSFPWGDHFEPSWAHMIQSAGDPPARAEVGGPPTDRSVYGMLGAAGNVRVWCINDYEAAGPDEHESISAVPSAESRPYRAVRGGSWYSEMHFCRCASRFAGRPAHRYSSVGIRLVSSVSPS